MEPSLPGPTKAMKAQDFRTTPRDTTFRLISRSEMEATGNENSTVSSDGSADKNPFWEMEWLVLLNSMTA